MDKNTVNALVEKLKALVAKGNVSRIVIRKADGSVFLDMSVNVGVIGGVVALSFSKWLVIGGALAAVGFGYTLEVVKESGEVVNVVKPEAGETVKKVASSVAETVKNAVDGFSVSVSMEDEAEDADVVVFEKEENKDN